MDASGIVRLGLTAVAATVAVIVAGLIAPAHRNVCTVVISTSTSDAGAVVSMTPANCATAGAQP